MKREQKTDNEIKRIMKGRAARILAVAVSVFLCALTLFEYVALRMEWDVPALAVISGDNGFWSGVYQKEELAFDDSTENILLEDAESVDSAAAQQGDDAERSDNAAGAGSGGGEKPDDAAEGNSSVGEKPDDAERSDDAAEGDSGAGEKPDDVAGAGSGGEEKPDDAERQDDTAGASDGGNAQVDDDAPGGAGTSNTGKTQGSDGEKELEFPYYIRINRKQNCITVYTQDDEGEYTVPYKAMICSTGLYNATPRGTYQISTKYLWRELYGGVYGQYATRIHSGVLFHSVPYYSRSKNSLCTDKYNKLGQQASMGCVRLTVEDAKWIAENCPEGTKVEIYDDDDPGPLGKPEAAKIDTDSPNKGWDPTDPDEDNPWHELSQDE